MQVVCSAQSTNLTQKPPDPTPSTHQLSSSVNQTVLLSSVNQTSVSASLPVTSVNASASVIGGSSKRRRRRSILSSNRTVHQYQFSTSAGNASNSNWILSRCHQTISPPTKSLARGRFAANQLATKTNNSKYPGLYRKSSIKPPGELIYFKPIWGRGLNRDGGLFERGGFFSLEMTIMVSVLHKELEYEVEKLKYKKF